MRNTMKNLLIASITLLLRVVTSASHVAPRHCHGSAKHIHLAVGHDPTSEMTISFATKWSDPEVETPLAGVHVGISPEELDRFVGEHEYPIAYTSTLLRNGGPYYSPYQHHITITGLEPATTYYYVVVVGEREDGLEDLEAMPLRDHPTQHNENWVAENYIQHESDLESKEQEEGSRLRRKLAHNHHDGPDKPCMDDHFVHSFTTAPETTTTSPVTFAIIGDLGQFDHSKETLLHMKDLHENATSCVKIDAVVLVGDIAYTQFNHRQWDAFFDFLDDYSIFAEVPLMVANGNHGT
jgi:hypothetical protein